MTDTATLNTEQLVQRIETLETKVTFQDELIEQLNQSLIDQHNDIRKLTMLIERLSTQLEDIQQPNIADISQEVPPPHY